MKILDDFLQLYFLYFNFFFFSLLLKIWKKKLDSWDLEACYMKIFMGPLKLHTAQELNIFLEKSTDVIIGYFWKKFGGQLEVHITFCLKNAVKLHITEWIFKKERSPPLLEHVSALECCDVYPTGQK